MARTVRSQGVSIADLPKVRDLEELTRLTNERLRQIAAAVGRTSTTTATSSGSSSGDLLLSVPGTLAVESNAAPLVSFAVDRTFAEVVALVKRAPTGAALVAEIEVDGAALATVTVADGGTEATVTAAIAVPAGSLVIANVTQVGTSFPGADLTLLLR